jgi:hypothetical protein
MALIDLKSDLSKFRADFNTPSLENKINGSNYNIDNVPTKHGNDVNQTNFKDISGANFNYPNLLINGKRLWQPAGTKNSKPVITFPGPQNFLNDNFSVGFTLNQSRIPTLNKSLYQGISDDGSTYTYPSGLGVIQPANSKFPVATFPGPQNFLNDGAATGFTLDAYKKGQSRKTSQFLGISADQKTYIYPSVLGPDGSNLMRPAGTPYSTIQLQNFNRKVRKIAKEKGYTLSEHGLKKNGKYINDDFSTEEKILKFLNIPYIIPENRL